MFDFRSAHKSSKKLLEQCQKLDKIWGHVFSAVITLNAPEAWYRKLRELIDRQQQGSLWMSQTKVRLFGFTYGVVESTNVTLIMEFLVNFELTFVNQKNRSDHSF